MPFSRPSCFLRPARVIHALSRRTRYAQSWAACGRRVPVTFWTMTMGVFAIAGIPPWAGFFSKDEILFNVFSPAPIPSAKLLWLVGLVTAGITSFYMFRLWFKTFFGAERFDENALAHGDESSHASGHAGEDMVHEPEHDKGQAAHFPRRPRAALDHDPAPRRPRPALNHRRLGRQSPPRSAAQMRSSTSSTPSSPSRRGWY